MREVRNAAEAKRHGVGVRVRLEQKRVLPEVAAERLPVADERREEFRLSVVERDRRVRDLELSELTENGLRFRSSCVDGFVMSQFALPSSSTLAAITGRSSSNGSNDDRVAVPDVSEHAS